MTRTETRSEADLPAERQEAGQAPRLPRSDVDPGRPRRPAVPSPEGPRPAAPVTWRLSGGARLRAVARDGRSGSAGAVHVGSLPAVTDQPPLERLTVSLFRRT